MQSSLVSYNFDIIHAEKEKLCCTFAPLFSQSFDKNSRYFNTIYKY